MLTQISKRSTTFAAPFRFREVAGRVVVTSYTGEYAVLSQDEFASFTRGDVEPSSPLYARLKAAQLVRAEIDVQALSDRIRGQRPFLNAGPNLHILVVTLRCNQTCVYCHASRAPMKAVETDMSTETAERSVDLALRTTNPAVTLEFQGGEPLVNFDVLRHVVAYALERNKNIGKELGFTLVSNLSLMDDEKLAWLLEHRVQICTSIDGTESIHDKQRLLVGSSSFDLATKWVSRINQAYIDAGLNKEVYHAEALLTTTRDTLPKWKEVIDTYVGLGCRALFLRPLDPFGFATQTGERLGYSTEEFLEFYRNSVDYMLELNQQGVQVLERFASIFLTKILAREDPNYLDLRSPCGAGIGQDTYNYDGKVFTCDEGRMLHEEGDDTFLIGDVRTSKYREMMTHETVRAMAVASNLDAQPDCVNCVYNPYCGVCPVTNHKSQGGLFGRMRDSSWCAERKGIQDYLFEKIGEGDPQVMETFRKWIAVRNRDHFLHVGGVS